MQLYSVLSYRLSFNNRTFAYWNIVPIRNKTLSRTIWKLFRFLAILKNPQELPVGHPEISLRRMPSFKDRWKLKQELKKITNKEKSKS